MVTHKTKVPTHFGYVGRKWGVLDDQGSKDVYLHGETFQPASTILTVAMAK